MVNIQCCMRGIINMTTNVSTERWRSWTCNVEDRFKNKTQEEIKQSLVKSDMTGVELWGHIITWTLIILILTKIYSD